MNSQAKVDMAKVSTILSKPRPNEPALIVTRLDAIGIAAGVTFRGRKFTADITPVAPPADGYEVGVDYLVKVVGDNVVTAALPGAPPAPLADDVLGGFHFAPGGNATARAGGDSVPAINQRSVWDLAFRPACPDPRGMTLVDSGGPRFWVDIYLLGTNHLEGGTSALGCTIADGDDPPQNPTGGYFARLDYETAVAVMKHHGKQLLSIDEFFAAAFGVTEKSAAKSNPKTTKVDAERTSKFGMMQATGNMWVWGHDGDPDSPRASMFGGSWLFGDDAGSRYADVDSWPGVSHVHLGARGRCDHLQLD